MNEKDAERINPPVHRGPYLAYFCAAGSNALTTSSRSPAENGPDDCAAGLVDDRHGAAPRRPGSCSYSHFVRRRPVRVPTIIGPSCQRTTQLEWHRDKNVLEKRP